MFALGVTINLKIRVNWFECTNIFSFKVFYQLPISQLRNEAAD